MAAALLVGCVDDPTDHAMGTTGVTSDELSMPLRFATVHFYGGGDPRVLHWEDDWGNVYDGSHWTDPAHWGFYVSFWAFGGPYTATFHGDNLENNRTVVTNLSVVYECPGGLDTQFVVNTGEVNHAPGSYDPVGGRDANRQPLGTLACLHGEFPTGFYGALSTKGTSSK